MEEASNTTMFTELADFYERLKTNPWWVWYCRDIPPLGGHLQLTDTGLFIYTENGNLFKSIPTENLLNENTRNFLAGLLAFPETIH